jgi:hypothetical protein
VFIEATDFREYFFCVFLILNLFDNNFDNEIGAAK